MAMKLLRRTLSITTWLVAVTSACGGDSADFRPAKTARDYPPVTDAFRVREIDPACSSIGVVHGEGEDAIPRIATTAARHGGTHYVVRGDEVDAYDVTGGVGRVRVVPHRRLWAEVYRCTP
jgi:hypothetical protein